MSEERDQSQQELSPLKRALFAVRDLRARLEAVEQARTEPIAVVGMACRFPGGASDLERFWALLDRGVDAVRPVPRDRWDADAYFDPNPETPGKTYAREGGFLDEIDRFDAGFFGIPPREVVSMDPQQRLLLEVVWEALENAGIPPSRLAGTRTGVFVGTSTSDYAHLMLSAETERADPYIGTGGIASVTAGRVAYILGLRGPTMAIDTACSSSLVAADVAVQQLRAGRCDAALVGGVNAMLTPKATVLMSSVRALSPTNRCRTFDADADGYVRGEGCGVVVLKRASDAQRDGDPILALIRGSATNHDGTSSGLTVPNGQAQQAVIRQALADAGLEPSAIDAVEAHGTGTPLGDPIEIRAIGAVLGEGRPPDRPLYVGAVKTNIGHLEASAGVAALIKAVLSVQRRRIPASLHFKRPNPNIPWNELPIRIPTESMAWPETAKPATIGVSSFGISGTNAHVIVQEAPSETPAAAEDRETHVITLSAQSDAALSELARRTASWIERDDRLSLADIAFSANTGRNAFEHRLAVAASSARALAQDLAAVARGETSPRAVKARATAGKPKVAFLFTGQGSQYAGMGRELYDAEPVFRAALDRCAAILQPLLPVPLLEVLFGGTSGDSAASPLHQTGYTQPALFSLEHGLAELWKSWGVEASFVAGHSVGEYVAACVAGLFSLEDGLRLIAERARLMQQLPAGGAMAAVLAPQQIVREAIRESGEPVSVAAVNGPENVVIAGPAHAVERVRAIARGRGIASKPLVVSHAFHSAMMEPILPEFERAAASVAWQTPRIRIVANLSGNLAAPGELATPAYWTRHIRETVQFESSVRTLLAQGCDTFIEIGPHPTLLALAAQAAGDRLPSWIPSLRRGQSEQPTILRSLGEAWTRGVAVDWRAVDQQRPHRRVLLPNYPFERQRYWFDAGQAAPRASRRPESWLHPLVHETVRSPLLKERVFQTQLSTDAAPYLSDHRVFDTVVFPATGYLEMARAAGLAAFEQRIGAVEQVVLEEPLVLHGDRPRLVQVALSRPERGESEFQIFSEPDAQGADVPWTRHARGRIRVGGAVQDEAAGRDLSSVRDRCADTMDVPAYYSRLAERGIEYGAAFQGIHALWRGRWESLSQLRLPDSVRADAGTYDVHPALLDSALQAIGAAFPPDHAVSTSGQLYLPLEMARVRVLEQPGDMVWSHAVVAEPSPEADVLAASVTWYDERGNLLLTLDGITVKRASTEALRRSIARPSDSLYEIAWQPVDLAAPTSSAAGERWVIFADAGTAGQAIAAELTAHGAACSVVRTAASAGPGESAVDPRRADDVERALTDAAARGAIHGVVHACALDDDSGTSSVDALEEREARLCGSLLHVAQALVRHRAIVGTPRLAVITRGAQPVEKDRPVDPVQASLWGIGRVIASEHPELNWIAVDLDPVAESIPSAVALLRRSDGENQVAIRRGQRYAPRLARISSSPATSPIAFDPDAVYLVTGGLSGLGLLVAESFAGRARHLVLCGRSAPSPEATAAIQRLESAGTQVTIARADMSRREDVQQVLDAIAASRKPLRGIVHAAGVVDDAVLAEQSWDRFSRVMAPKVRGSWLLHEMTADAPLDFFVMFSSTTAVLGAPGQANYAAANAFMDALAHARRAMGRPALSINWGAWADVGMVARMDSRNRERIATSGVIPLAPDAGLRLFETLLGGARPQVIVLQANWRQILQGFARGQEPPLLQLIARETARSAPEERFAAEGLRKRLADASADERQALLTDYARAQVARVLGLTSPGAVDDNREFGELGLDSLMMLELRNALAGVTARTLSATFLYEHSTVERVAAALAADGTSAGAEAPIPAAGAVSDDAAALLARLGDLSDDNIDTLLGAMLTESETQE